MPSDPKNIESEDLRNLARHAVLRLQEAGHKAYWAGGCVRDILLGRLPKDYDIATSARPEEVMQLFPGAVAVGKAFGVVRAPIGKATFEVSTFRSDISYSDGRHPDAVVYSDPEQDALRRDFTVNAIFYDPSTETFFDYVDGMKDIRDRILRFVGDPLSRINEDHLRMIRAVRLAATLKFKISPETLEAIRANAHLIRQISSERIRDELTRLLLESPKAGQALKMLEWCGLLYQILPEVANLKGQQQPPEFHPEGDVFDHTIAMLDLMEKRSEMLALAVLLHDVGKPATAQVNKDERIRFPNHAAISAEIAETVMKRLRFPSRTVERVTDCIRRHMKMADVQKMRQSTLRRLVGAEDFDLDLELHRLDCLASHRKLQNYAFLVEFREKLKSEPVLPAPWVNGHDIISLGVSEGPDVGKWRRIAYDAQLEGNFTNREDLLGWLKSKIQSQNPH